METWTEGSLIESLIYDALHEHWRIYKVIDLI